MLNIVGNVGICYFFYSIKFCFLLSSIARRFQDILLLPEKPPL